jgi:DNA invertase Pin-like site-specific DNA recombinase
MTKGCATILNATMPDKRHLGQSRRQPHASHNAPQMTKAYSYVRFSTPDQAKGDSYRRQTEAANEYARRHGLVLDTELTLTDQGVSAFRGANAKAGALSTFLEAVKDGTIAPGSYLLVENLDRLTRADVLEAQELFTRIIRRGITLVTLFDQRAYSAESVTANPMDLVFSILTMVRGHEESVTKSRRMLAVFERKRLDAANRTERNPFTRMRPAWLRWNETTRQYEVIEDRANIVRDIFAKTDAGWGKHRITNALNEAQVETWGNGSSALLGLHSDTVQGVCKQFVANRAVSYLKRRYRLWRSRPVDGNIAPVRTAQLSAPGKKSLGWIPFAAARAVKLDGDVKTGCFAQDARGRCRDC